MKQGTQTIVRLGVASVFALTVGIVFGLGQ